MGWIGAIVAGAVIAIIVSLLPGKLGLRWWVVWLAGIGGALLGYWLAGLLGVAETGGIDWIRWLISIVVASVLVVVARLLFGKKA